MPTSSSTPPDELHRDMVRPVGSNTHEPRCRPPTTKVYDMKKPRTLCICIAAAGLLPLVGCGGSDAATPEPTTPGADREANSVMFDCLLDRGFPVVRGDDGGVQFSDPDDDRFAEYQEASAECEQVLVDRGLLDVQSSADLRAEYILAAALHDCLVVAGFPLIDLPTEDVYVERHDGVDILASTAPIDIEQARASCPDEFAALDGQT